MKNNLIWLPFLLVLISCSSKNDFPLWKITKAGYPTSYLLGSTEYLTEDEVNDRISDEVLDAFNASNTLITYWDLEKSDLEQTNRWIELGNGKTIKDSLPDFYSILKLSIQGLPNQKDSIEHSKLKPQFFLYDKLNYKDQLYFNMDNFWLRLAMPKLKNLKGLETFQEHYQKLSNTDLIQLESFITTNTPLKTYYENGFVAHKLLWEKGELNKMDSLLNPFDLFFKNEKEKKTYFNNLYESWGIKLETLLQENSCFISLDIKHLYGNPNLLDKLLLKGYKVELVS